MDSPQSHHRSVFALVTLVLFTDSTVYDLVVPFLPDFAAGRGIGSAGVGLLFGAYALALLISAPLARRLCDRFGAVLALRLGIAGIAASQLLFALTDGVPLLFAARAMQGAAGGIAWTAGLSLLASTIPAARRGEAFGSAMAGLALGTLVGPPLGGLLFDFGGPQAPFVAAAAFTVSLAVLSLVLPMPTSALVVSRYRIGWRQFILPGTAVVIGSVLLSALEPTLPVFLEAQLHAGASQIGGLFALAALLYGLCSPLAGRAADRWGSRRVMGAGAVACAFTLPLLAVAATWPAEAAALMAFGASCAFLLTPALPEIAATCNRLNSDCYATGYAIFNLAYAGGMAAGPIVGGALAPAFGFGTTLLLLSGVVLLSVPLLLGWRVRSQSIRADQSNQFSCGPHAKAA